MPTPAQQTVTDILADNDIEVYDEIYHRRLTWPASTAAPPLTKADVAELSLPALDPATAEEWPPAFIPHYTDGTEKYPVDPDDPNIPANLFDAHIKNLVLDLSRRSLSAEVVQSRQKGSRDFSLSLTDDNDASLQNVLRPNDVISWYQSVYNPNRPEKGEQRIHMGDYLVDSVNSSQQGGGAGTLSLQGRDALKLLMLDTYEGRFEVDRIDESRDTLNSLGKVKMTMVKSASDSDRIVFIVDTDKSGNPIPPVYNWSNTPEPRLSSVKYGQTAGFTRVSHKEGAWTILFGAGAVWINRQWYDEKMGWEGWKVGDAGDPLTMGNTPKRDLWVEFSRYILPEDVVTIKTANAPLLATPIGTDGAGKQYIQLDAATPLPASIIKYHSGCTVNFDKNIASNKRIFLADTDVANNRIYVQVQKLSDGSSVAVTELNLAAGDTGYIGEISRPETRIKQVLIDAGFQETDAAKPFYIEKIEPVFSGYYWDDVTDWDGLAVSGTKVNNIVNADLSYPQSFALDANAGATHVFDDRLFMAHYRRTVAVQVDIAKAGVNFVPHWEVYDAITGGWVDASAQVVEDTTEGFTKSGYVVFNTTFMVNNQRHYNSTTPANGGTAAKMGLTAYTDPTYTYRFLLRLSRTAGTSPIFAMLRPCAPLQTGQKTFKQQDEIKHWEVMEKHIRPFLPPNYDWYDPGNLNIRCRLLAQAATENYVLDKVHKLEKQESDSELYTDVVAQGRRLDLVNLASSQNGRKPVAWIPYRAKWWQGSAYEDRTVYDHKDPQSLPLGTYMAHPDYADDSLATLWIGADNTETTETMKSRSLQFHNPAVGSHVKKDKKLARIEGILDNSTKTMVGDAHKYKMKGKSKNGIIEEDKVLAEVGTLDGLDYVEENQTFDDTFILAVKLDAVYDIGQIFLSAGSLPPDFIRSGGEYDGEYMRPYMMLEIWKSETTDDLSEYEIMVSQFGINRKDKKLFKADEFVSRSNRAKYIRIKCVEAAKAVDFSIKRGWGRKFYRRSQSAWQLASLRIYQDDIIRQKVTLGEVNLTPSYTAVDLERDKRWRRRVRPRTKVIETVNEFANTEEDVRRDAIAWLREIYRSFLSFKLSGCRPDLQVGDTVEIAHPYTDDYSVWAGMFTDTSGAISAQDQARVDFLTHTKDFLVEEVTRQHGGQVSATLTAYRGR